MPSRLLDLHAATPRDKLLRAVLIVLAVSQLLAFYMLCSHQVRKQEARQTAVEVERMAVSDCLRYLSNSTIASCSPRHAAAQAQGATGPDVVPVNYAWR